MAHLTSVAVTTLNGRGKEGGDDLGWGSGSYSMVLCVGGVRWGGGLLDGVRSGVVCLRSRVESVKRGPELVHQHFASLMGKV